MCTVLYRFRTWWMVVSCGVQKEFHRTGHSVCATSLISLVAGFYQSHTPSMTSLFSCIMTADPHHQPDTNEPVGRVHPADLPPMERQRLFALRFRTEQCRTFVESGECRYRDRCMFAHGENELRTQTMNEADDLTSDKAVRVWIRDRRREAYTAKVSATAIPMVPTNDHVDNTTPRVQVLASDLSSDDARSSCHDEYVAFPSSQSTASATPRGLECISNESECGGSSASMSLLGPVVFRYRYNPYSMLRVKLLS